LFPYCFYQNTSNTFGNLNAWDVSGVTNLSYTFQAAGAFNQPLNNWNTSSVTNMAYLFNGALVFNQPLNNWNTGNVTSMANMFEYSNFNKPLNNWNTSKVKDMTEKRNNIGARIDDAGKDKVIKLLNTLVGSTTYTNTNTEHVNQLGICIVIELLMRLFSDQKRNNKYYYITSEQAMISEVIKKSFSS